MKQFWVDFSGSMLIKANNEEEAKEFFSEELPCGIDFISIEDVQLAADDEE